MPPATIDAGMKVRFRSESENGSFPVGRVLEVSSDNARGFLDGTTKLVPELSKVSVRGLRNMLTLRRLEHPVTDQLFSHKAPLVLRHGWCGPHRKAHHGRVGHRIRGGLHKPVRTPQERENRRNRFLSALPRRALPHRHHLCSERVPPNPRGRSRKI